MPDGTILETKPPVATPSPAAPAPQQVVPAAPVFTQAQVDAIRQQDALAAQQAHDSVFAAMRRANEAKPKPADPPPTTKPDPASSTTSSVEQMANLIAQAVSREAAFGEAVRSYGFSEEQVAVLRSLSAAAQLSDAAAVTAFVKEKAPVFGKTATLAAPVIAANNATPTVPAPIAPSAPSTAVPLERDVSIMEMSAEQVHELIRKKGGDPSRPYDPRNRKARREIRIETEAALRTRRIGLSMK